MKKFLFSVLLIARGAAIVRSGFEEGNVSQLDLLLTAMLCLMMLRI